MKLLDKVKKRLEENYGIDFLSEFWTDDQIVLLEDIVDATEKEVNNINYIPCCEQLTVKEWEIDFGGDVLAGLEITNNEPKIIGAMNGWGNGIDKEAITITQK